MAVDLDPAGCTFRGQSLTGGFTLGFSGILQDHQVTQLTNADGTFGGAYRNREEDTAVVIDGTWRPVDAPADDPPIDIEATARYSEAVNFDLDTLQMNAPYGLDAALNGSFFVLGYGDVSVGFSGERYVDDLFPADGTVGIFFDKEGVEGAKIMDQDYNGTVVADGEGYLVEVSNWKSDEHTYRISADGSVERL